ncbi:MAG: TlpA family protein disulfide reductase [Pyrinomonadaceae bacterium]
MRALAIICFLFVGAAGQDPKPLPEFSLVRLNGQTLSSQELKNNIVVLDFWATWCAPCIDEVPIFNKLQKKYYSRGVRVIGLAAQSGWARDIRKFVARHPMNYMVVVGNDAVVADFGVINFPTTYLIAPGWKVYKKYSGADEINAAVLERDIEALLTAK